MTDSDIIDGVYWCEKTSKVGFEKCECCDDGKVMFEPFGFKVFLNGIILRFEHTSCNYPVSHINLKKILDIRTIIDEDKIKSYVVVYASGKDGVGRIYLATKSPLHNDILFEFIHLLHRRMCGCSSGIGPGSVKTFGHGKKDEFGFFDKPCYCCARVYQEKHGVNAWPPKIDKISMVPSFLKRIGNQGV